MLKQGLLRQREEDEKKNRATLLAVKDRWLAVKDDANKKTCQARLDARASSKATNLLQILPLKNTEEFVTGFLKSREYDRVVNGLPGLTETKMLVTGANHPHPLFAIQLVFASKKKAKSALKMIMACHHGNVWPPFGVTYVDATWERLPNDTRKMPAATPPAAST